MEKKQNKNKCVPLSEQMFWKQTWHDRENSETNSLKSGG